MLRRAAASCLLLAACGAQDQNRRLLQRRGEEKKAEELRDRPDIPGWLVERLYHNEPLTCPWLAGSKTDEACARRTEKLSRMRDQISNCPSPFKRSDRAIGHRGAALVAPEETIASWQIGAESGAGYLECDVAVTGDLDLVCRHGSCDLAFTTDLVTHHPELNAKCSKPFRPGSGEEAVCCTYDFTRAELSSLCAKMESVVNASAGSLQGYVLGAPGFRSGAVAEQSCHKFVFYHEYLKLLKENGYHAIPELKDTALPAVQGFLASKGKDVHWFADRFAEALLQHGFQPWPKVGHAAEPGSRFGVMQTFDREVAAYWKKTRPEMTVEYMWNRDPPPGQDCNEPSDCGGPAVLKGLHELGVELFAPPINVLLSTGADHSIVPSATAGLLKELKVRAIGSWSLEREGCRSEKSAQLQPAAMAPCGEKQPGSFYYGPLEGQSTFQHADVLEVLDVLFRQVGLEALFSDFPGTVAAYANCVLGER